MIATIAQPRLTPILTVITGALVATYVALMISTILFAALQTQLAQNMQDSQMQISKLENTYYAAVANLDATDPHTLGYVTPQKVEYVTQASASNLTFAN